MMAHHPRGISPEIELQAAEEELDLARKKIDRYAHLVTTLYDELDTLRNSICKNCKRKLGPSTSWSSFAGCNSSGHPAPSLWRRLWGWLGRPPNTNSDRETEPTVYEPRTLETPSTSSSTTHVSFVESVVPLPFTQLVPIATTGHGIIAPVTPSQHDWSVLYNHKVKQALKVHLVDTLEMKSIVHCVKFSRDGKYLAVGLETGETYIYDMKTLSNRILRLRERPVRDGAPIWTVQFSPDHKYVATGGGDGQIRIWNIANKHVLATFKGHKYTAFCTSFSPNSRFLVSGSFDGSVRIWCMRDGSSRALCDATDTEMSLVMSITLSPDGRHLAAANDVGILRIWDFRSGRLLHRWKGNQTAQCVHSVVFTSDGKRLLSGGNAGVLRCWDVSWLMAPKQWVSRRNAPVGGSVNEILTFERDQGIFSISTLPDSRWVLSGSSTTGSVHVWDARTGDWQCILNGHQKNDCTVTDGSPDGHHLASGSKGCLVRVWRYEQAG